MRNYIPYDHFAVPLELNIRGQTKRKSYCGFLTTLLLVGIVAWYFLVDLIKLGNREDPSVAISEVSVPEPPLASLDEFMIAFEIGHPDLVKDYHYKILVTTYDQETNNYIDLDYRPCEEDDLGEFYNDIVELPWIDIENLYCVPDQDGKTVKGTLTALTFQTLYVNLVQCLGSGCADLTESAELIGNSQPKLFFSQPYFDANDYEHPIKYYLQEKIYDFSCDAKPKQVEMYMSPITVTTDDGVIGSSISSESTLRVDAIEPTDYNSDTCNLNFQFQLNNRRTDYKRTYKKLTDILAGVTGVASTIALILTLALGNYFEMKREEEVVNRVFFNGPNTIPLNIKFHQYVLGKIFRVKRFKNELERLEKKSKEVLDFMDVANIARCVAYVGQADEGGKLMAKDVELHEVYA